MITLGTRLTAGAEPFAIDPVELRTHMAIVGASGSGKTGLAVSLLESVALSGRSALVFDPKGDLGGLCYAFGSPQEFAIAIDPSEAERAGMSLDQYSALVCKRWCDGRRAAGISDADIGRYRTEIDFEVMTPGNSIRPVSILKSFACPEPHVMANTDLLAERTLTAARSLLGLLPRHTIRQENLVTAVLRSAWECGADLSLADICAAVVDPALVRIGAQDVETYTPRRQRLKLSRSLNDVIASPSFAVWSAGESLDIDTAFGGDKPRITVLSLAHLDEAARMMFIGLALSDVLAWLSKQSGTSDLRALLFLDELAQMFPPTKVTPVSAPLMRLVRESRAFGLGLVLAAQNVGQIKYQALSNVGTWCIGKLSQARDVDKLASGLDASAYTAGRDALRSAIGGLRKRQFVIQSANGLDVIQSRHALTFLAGPLSTDALRWLAGGQAVVNHAAELRQRLEAINAAIKIAESELAELEKGSRSGFDIGTGLRVLLGGRYERTRALSSAVTGSKTSKTASEARARLETLRAELADARRALAAA